MKNLNHPLPTNDHGAQDPQLPRVAAPPPQLDPGRTAWQASSRRLRGLILSAVVLAHTAVLAAFTSHDLAEVGMRGNIADGTRVSIAPPLGPQPSSFAAPRPSAIRRSNSPLSGCLAAGQLPYFPI